MTRVEVTAVVDRARLEQILRPRTDTVVERPAGEGRFELATGPVLDYCRRVEVDPAAEGRCRVTQVVEYRLRIPFWGWLFALPLRREDRRLPHRGRAPWWAPPSVLDARAAASLGALALLSLVTGYLGTLVTQTMAFAGRDFGVGASGQGLALAALRADILLAIVWVARADRHGRRFALLAGAGTAAALTSLAALSPSLPGLVALQLPAKGLTSACAILIGVVAAEEVAAGARAWTASILAMSAALGSGAAVAVLPVADLGRGGWRVPFALAVLFVPLVVGLRRHLAESRRFVRHRGEAPARLRGHGRRLGLLATGGLLTWLFFTPISQLQNTYLTDERGFSAARITLFTLLTGTPGAIGIVVGGQLADRRGRRGVAVVALAVAAACFVVTYNTAGAGLWTFAVIGGIAGGATVPALAVYGPELFPTSLRGRANGVISGVGRIGSALGLVLAGLLAERLGSFGPAVAALSAGPVLLCVLILAAYPETAARELEDLNPEDGLPPGQDDPRLGPYGDALGRGVLG